MTRLRENAESVAFYRGEAMEARDLRVKFDQVWKYWWDFMRQQKQLSWFLSGYGQIAIIFPILVASPRYFSGAIELGVLMQIASAFGNVQGSLSWFANNFGGDTDSGLAPWKATIDRLTGFVDAMERAEQIETGFDVKPSARPELAVANATLKLPSGKVLVENLSMQIPVGDRLLVSGPSGSGKTTLFRALAGIWPFGSGEIAQPSNGRALFLPQRPYLPIGSLRGALAYPAESGQIETAEARSALADVGLAQLADRLDEESDWSKELSGGEQQRLAIARALISKPDWLYLDEATSALDTENEQRMYRLLAERLPAATVLSIAHRPDVGKYHARRLTIDPENRRADISPIAAE
jgi:putative ATP-binding cassette transporter